MKLSVFLLWCPVGLQLPGGRYRAAAKEVALADSSGLAPAVASAPWRVASVLLREKTNLKAASAALPTIL